MLGDTGSRQCLIEPEFGDDNHPLFKLAAGQSRRAGSRICNPPTTAIPMARRSFARVASLVIPHHPEQIIAVVDVDHFRAIRDLHGVAAAAALLRTVGHRIDTEASTRGGICVPLGSDEFAVLMPFCSEMVDVERSAGTLLDAVSLPFSHQGTNITFSVSLGFALLPDHSDTAEAALRYARLAVLRGKRSGSGLVTAFSNGQLAETTRRDVLSWDLGAAIAAGQMVPFYQPVMCLRTGQVTGMEVLARWIHPLHGMLEPAAFIPLVEEQGLCSELTRALYQQVQTDSANWPAHWNFAFNTAANGLHTLLTLFQAPAPFATIDPRRIELEVTENALMTDLDLSRRAVALLREYGVRLVVDDFGMGYANFQQLRQIPFSRLKIDKSFITDMMDDMRTEACAQAIIGLAHSLGMTATAEGVESRAVAERLRHMGCDNAQGYYYARAMPAADVARLAAGTIMYQDQNEPALS